MTLSVPVTRLICDEKGAALRSFLGQTSDAWAAEHMQRRYNATPPQEGDDPEHPAVLCYQALKWEYGTLRGWFGEDGTISRLLMSRSLGKILQAPIGNGIGWDFQVSGEIEPRMLQFKGTLIACRRTVDLRPRSEASRPDAGSSEIGGIVRLVRAAYQTRAELKTWEPAEDRHVTGATLELSGADLAKRWIAFQTYNYLRACGAEATMAWSMAKCRDCFGYLVV